MRMESTLWIGQMLAVGRPMGLLTNWLLNLSPDDQVVYLGSLVAPAFWELPERNLSKERVLEECLRSARVTLRSSA